MSSGRHSGSSQPGDERVFLAAGDDENVLRLADEMLCEAYDLVLSGWCQGASARDGAGREVEPASASARSWSASGALERAWRRSDVDPDLALAAFTRANVVLASVVSGVPQAWNDAEGRTVVQVLDALAEAALKTKESEGSSQTEPPGRRPGGDRGW